MDLKADGILEYWSELVLQIPDAHEEYTDIFSKDVEPSRGKTGSHDTSFDNAVANVSG